MTNVIHVALIVVAGAIVAAIVVLALRSLPPSKVADEAAAEKLRQREAELEALRVAKGESDRSLAVAEEKASWVSGLDAALREAREFGERLREENAAAEVCAFPRASCGHSIATLAGMGSPPFALLGLFLLGCGGTTASGGPSGRGGGDASASDALEEAPSVAPADAGRDAPVDVDSAACTFLASNYDQSCTTDTDCTEVSSGDYCSTSVCLNCGGSPISVAGAALFNADISNTPRGSGAIPPPNCSCPSSIPIPPCCVAGTCHVAEACLAAEEADAAPNDASGYTPDYTVLCVGDAGPQDGGPADAAAVPGVSRWCNGAEECLPFNGGWACCVLMGAPFATCVGP